LEHELSASLETLVVAAYMFADDAAAPRPGPDGLTTDAELVALSVAQASIGIVSDRRFLGLIGKLLPGWFPHLPFQSRYNRRLRRLAPVLAAVQLRLAELRRAKGNHCRSRSASRRSFMLRRRRRTRAIANSRPPRAAS
jgi:hypothetical protein